MSAQFRLGPEVLAPTWHRGMEGGGRHGLLAVNYLTTLVTLGMPLVPGTGPWKPEPSKPRGGTGI